MTINMNNDINIEISGSIKPNDQSNLIKLESNLIKLMKYINL